MGDDGTQDIRAGSESTLVSLYRDVPAAEEFDLVERTRLDLEQRRYSGRLEIDEPLDDEAVDLDEEEPDEPLSPGQAIGMIEHVLEAEVIDDPDDRDDAEG